MTQVEYIQALLELAERLNEITDEIIRLQSEKRS